MTTFADAPCVILAADDPRHETRAGYLAGCRCFGCHRANRVYCKRYRTRRILAGGEVTTPVSTVRPHIQMLRATMSLGGIASAANTSASHILRITSGETKRVTNGMASRILAIQPTTNVGTKWVDAGGARRRIQSLVALGHSLAQIDRHLGYGRQNLWLVAHGQRRCITSAWDCRIRAAWDALSMRLPEPLTKHDRGAVTRSLNAARANGWPPPLAWTDIDDPDEQPHGWQYVSGDRHADLDDLLDRGASVSEACRVLGVTVTALEKWMGRHGRRDDFNTLRARETPPTYQQKKWTA